MLTLAQRMGQEIKLLKTEVGSADDITLGNVSTLPENVVLQLKGNSGGGSASFNVSNDLDGEYLENQSIFISKTNMAYFKSSEGWIEIGQLKVGNDFNSIFYNSGSVFFLLSDGTVKSCGSNNYGQLGDGTTTDQSTPVTVSGVSNVKEVITHSATSYFLLNDGTVKACGRNQYGQLGNGTTTDQSTPVTLIGVSNVKEIKYNLNGAIYFLLNDGTVKACGRNKYGQLGDGTTVDKSTAVTVIGVNNVKEIIANGNAIYFLLSDGTVKAVGLNTSGQLGDGSNINRSLAISVMDIVNCKNVYFDGLSVFFLLNDGTVKSAGFNHKGQLGDGTVVNKNIPTVVLNISNCKEVLTNINFSTYFLLSDGTVKACGSNNYGQLGNGTTTDQSTPVTLIGVSNVKEIKCKIAFNTPTNSVCFLLNDGTVKACGRNQYGQLGDGTTVDKSTAVTVIGVSDCNKLYFNGNSTYFLLSDGTVKAVGYNVYGALGNGTTTNQSTPVSVVGITNCINITQNSANAYFLLNNGIVKSVGYNVYGQLGDDTEVNRSTPVDVLDLNGLLLTKQLDLNEF